MSALRSTSLLAMETNTSSIPSPALALTSLTSTHSHDETCAKAAGEPSEELEPEPDESPPAAGVLLPPGGVDGLRGKPRREPPRPKLPSPSREADRVGEEGSVE